MEQPVKYTFKQKIIQHKDLNIPNMSPDQFQALSKMFSQPSSSSSEEYVKTISLLGKTPQMPLEVQYDMILVTDDMTIKHLLEKWYLCQFSNQQQKKSSSEYFVMYEKGKQKFVLDEKQTILDFKSRLGTQKIPHDVYLRIYDSDCQLYQDECSMVQSDFIKFEQKQNKIDIPIKVLINHQRAYYFYIENVSPSITFQKLHQNIEKQLESNKDLLQCVAPIKYTLSVQKENNSKIFEQKLNKLKIPLEKVWNKNKLTLDILDQKIGMTLVRQLCSPGEIIQLKFTDDCFKLVQSRAANDCEIIIKYYNKIDKDENSPKTARLTRNDIVMNFSEVSKMRISTLLKQRKIEEPLTTCLYLNNTVIRPTVKFEQIKQIQNLMQKNKQIVFVCLSDNFVFYQELVELSLKQKETSVDDLLNHFQQKKIINIQQKNRKGYTQVRKQKEDKLRTTPQVKKQHKIVKFFDPIMLYTTNLIYWMLNLELRTTSVCLFSKDKTFQQWHYKISQKIINNLMQLDNFRGTVYRGTGSFQYNYKAGTIVQWCCFTSTSINKSKTLIFSTGNYPYLFEIKTFAGKSIEYFSQFQTQSQILIMPYTKFKVLEVEKRNQNDRKYTYVKLLELPIPKRVPGHAVVWIDNNLKENYNYFEQIKTDLKLKNFDLIQLQSNQHFVSWLHAYKYLLDMPHMKLHFITNMNRTLERKKQGIDTLEIIRSFDKKAAVVFFIYDIESKKKDLKARGKDNDDKVFVIESTLQLRNIFISQFLNQQERKELPKLYQLKTCQMY